VIIMASVILCTSIDVEHHQKFLKRAEQFKSMGDYIRTLIYNDLEINNAPKNV